MIRLLRTNSENKDFIELVRNLDLDLAKRDGNEHTFYAQFNKIAALKYVVVAYENNRPLGCGAMKEYDMQTMEVKRMFVSPESRGKGIATKILSELEAWAAELFYSKCILEIGKKQPEAIQLYKKCGFNLIPNYGQYTDVENSLCFEKVLINNLSVQKQM